jgi:hypothetical protein
MRWGFEMPKDCAGNRNKKMLVENKQYGIGTAHLNGNSADFKSDKIHP